MSLQIDQKVLRVVRHLGPGFETRQQARDEVSAAMSRVYLGTPWEFLTDATLEAWLAQPEANEIVLPNAAISYALYEHVDESDRRPAAERALAAILAPTAVCFDAAAGPDGQIGTISMREGGRGTFSR